MPRLTLLASTALAFTLAACASNPPLPPITRAASVDLPRFMGDWYVIGFIPIFPERNAHNGIETYALNADGSIATTYRYRDSSFDAPLTVNRPKGFVEPDTGNALWGMQFLWPFKGEFLITELADDYSSVVIARSKRDMVWLLARKPEMSDADYARHLARITAMGYDPATIRRVPQRWPAP